MVIPLARTPPQAKSNGQETEAEHTDHPRFRNLGPFGSRRADLCANLGGDGCFEIIEAVSLQQKGVGATDDVRLVEIENIGATNRDTVNPRDFGRQSGIAA